MKKTYTEPQITVVEINAEGIIAVSWSERDTMTMDATPARRGNCWDEYEQR